MRRQVGSAPARRLWPAALLALLIGFVAPTTARADQGALCDAAAEGCGVTTSKSSVNAGETLHVRAQGNPGVEVSLRFFLVEFNSDGAITGLTPQGPARTATTSDRGRADLEFAPGAGDGNAASSGGWGFVGFADDDSLDLAQRLGAIVAFGNSAMRLLGDGYAYQKPVETELDLHVVGNKRAGYWVEYHDADGRWVPLAGQGPDAPINLRNTPGEIGHIPYTVPGDLIEGKPYTFRLNTVLNYSGGTLLKDAGFTEWIVVPSGDPKKRGRGNNFDPSLPAGKPDRVEPVPSYSPKPSESPTPSPSPTPSDSGTPTAKPTPRPSVTRTPSARPSPSATRSAQPTPSSNPTSTSTPTPTPSAPQSSPSPSPAPSPRVTDDAAVWGNEATPPPSQPASVRPASFPVAVAVAALLLLLAAAPLGWWGWSRHRLASQASEELL